MATLRIQSILFHNETQAIERTLDCIQRAADLAIAQGCFSAVQVAYGDCSPAALFDDETIARLQAAHADYFSLDVTHFDANLGSAKGHNTLLQASEADYLLIMNPDVVLAPNALIELARPLMSLAGVGMVEARQLPIEHPKAYNPVTGETSWATTACALIPASVFAQIGAFDNETFFLYCDDVDFSWRVRLAGLKVVYQPSATVFHDKRLSNDAGWLPSNAEKYYSAEAALLLPSKWSRPDIAERILKQYQGSGIEYLERAAAEYKKREAEGRLPHPLDADHRVAEFVGDMYTTHRFTI